MSRVSTLDKENFSDALMLRVPGYTPAVRDIFIEVLFADTGCIQAAFRSMQFLMGFEANPSD